ncbi:hypothetical protein PP410_gp15 [Vibrio phage NF]|uniref:Uncharacterized protein n=1 Tax=Vibrio phage NF TaxID=2686202 RepID=A0A6B9J003_9CAUD|nr:hypothetical protein PP410_gp15 [Vibrio phage NF]QGZ13232.1 hypothetical protein [Vibrio phage NF]
MGKYEWVLSEIPEGVTHIDLKVALSMWDKSQRSEFLRPTSIWRMHKKSKGGWYKLVHDDLDKKYAFGNSVRCEFKMVNDSLVNESRLISVDAIKILARQFG